MTKIMSKSVCARAGILLVCLALAATTSIYLQSLDETVRSTDESLVGQGDFSEKVLTKSSPEPDQD